jgi:hypothetical protein
VHCDISLFQIKVDFCIFVLLFRFILIFWSHGVILFMKFKLVLFFLILLPFVHSTSFAVVPLVIDEPRSEQVRKPKPIRSLNIGKKLQPIREKTRSEQVRKPKPIRSLSIGKKLQPIWEKPSETVDEQSRNSRAAEVKVITGIALTAKGSPVEVVEQSRNSRADEDDEQSRNSRAAEVKVITGIALTAKGSRVQTTE